ncbi:DUF3813 domain-containing protein [Sutcliffiella deserti]|uniref:DUF3813 domain-containing protein n=1 Tax=Sutcliffiella deserti TaxID=2875501 RepID=UPI001CBD5E48|nr:DUF3813 domain-containing protein [Sutcliffiella deserti]
MGNQLFQSAREAVIKAEKSNQISSSVQNDISVAKNALSSAYANSTEAEQRQLHELQDRLQKLE